MFIQICKDFKWTEAHKYMIHFLRAFLLFTRRNNGSVNTDNSLSLYLNGSYGFFRVYYVVYFRLVKF